MKSRALVLLHSLLAAAALSACGKPAPPPAPVAEIEPIELETPAAQVNNPAPMLPPPVNDPEYVPTPIPAPPPEYGGVKPEESMATKAATAAIPADAIGGSPVTNEVDAWQRGEAALRKYCEDNKWPFSEFGFKEHPAKTGNYWTMRYFGVVNGQGHYVGVRVYPDGRAEIIR